MLLNRNLLFEKIAAKFYPKWRLEHTEQLTGGVSAQLTTLVLTQPVGKTHKVIVRQHGEADHTCNPNIAQDEFDLLQRLQAVGIPVPSPYHVDTSCEILATPYLIIEYIGGETVFAPTDVESHLRQFAAMLAHIHQVNLQQLRASALPQIEGAMKYAAIHQNQEALLHGDYWLGNVLWHDSKLIAVVDWEDAAIGNPLSDVANARLEVLWALGKDAMHTFTRQYQALMPQLDYTSLSRWDLAAAQATDGVFVPWAQNEDELKVMLERHTWFTTQAQKMLL